MFTLKLYTILLLSEYPPSDVGFKNLFLYFYLFTLIFFFLLNKTKQNAMPKNHLGILSGTCILVRTHMQKESEYFIMVHRGSLGKFLWLCKAGFFQPFLVSLISPGGDMSVRDNEKLSVFSYASVFVLKLRTN